MAGRAFISSAFSLKLTAWKSSILTGIKIPTQALWYSKNCRPVSKEMNATFIERHLR